MGELTALRIGHLTTNRVGASTLITKHIAFIEKHTPLLAKVLSRFP